MNRRRCFSCLRLLAHYHFPSGRRYWPRVCFDCHRDEDRRVRLP